MNLSDHFTWEELTRTEVRSLQEENRAASVEFIPNLKRLADEVLEPVRALFPGKRVFVHSGFRCLLLNSVIGGSPTSRHMKGAAADLTVEDVDLIDVLHTIMNSSIRFHQLLIEAGCIHIDLPDEDTVMGEVAYWDKGIKVNIRMAV